MIFLFLIAITIAIRRILSVLLLLQDCEPVAFKILIWINHDPVFLFQPHPA